MMNRYFSKYIALVALLMIVFFSAGCSGRSYKNQKPFSIYLNGKPYTFELDETFADIGRMESDFPHMIHYGVMFPAKLYNIGSNRGFTLSIDPGHIKSKETLQFSAQDSQYTIKMTFSPVISQNRFKNGLMEMSTTEGKGRIHASFDILEARENGRVKGIVYEAVMEGFFLQNPHDPIDAKNKPKPARIEIYNFSFDTTF